MTTSTGLQGFDNTIHQTNSWLNEISDQLGDQRRGMSYHALRGVLFALRDRMPVDEVFDLSAQLPMLLRGLFFEGYNPTGKPEKLSPDEFLERVSQELEPIGGGNPENACRAVFRVLEEHVTPGEVDDLRSALPENVRRLWPQTEAE